MIGWLYRMIIGHFSPCEHKWEYVGQLTEYLTDSVKEKGDKLPQAVHRTWICEKCKASKKVYL